MSLTNEEREAIVALRKQKAWRAFEEAKGIATLGYWDAVAGGVLEQMITHPKMNRLQMRAGFGV